MRFAAVRAIVLAVALGGRADAVGTLFTYQGELRQGGVPQSGVCDFRFSLFGASSGGVPLATVTAPPTTVTAGRFTALLDFGAAFPGADRWLEIEVRCPTAVGSFTLLGPRQQMTGTPYAQTANLAATANAVADNAVTSAKIADLGVATADLANGAVTDAKVASGIQYAKLTGAPTALPPAGTAGGGLSGTYPNPTIATDAVGSTQIVNGSIAAVDVNPAQIQSRVTGSCTTGNAVRIINQDGTVQCELAGSALVTQLNSLQQQVAALQTLLAGVTRADGTLRFEGMNLQIVSGGGATDAEPNGLGNLIIGYNATSVENRGGSHNLVLGDFHSYSSFAGIVAGHDNEISAPWASVTGGAMNKATSEGASVTGGLGNEASALYASVSGGDANVANGPRASVTGGAGNTATGEAAVVTAGLSNLVSAQWASISGGICNSAGPTNIGACADPGLGGQAIGGGYHNIVQEMGASGVVSGGRNNLVNNAGAVVSGGSENAALGTDSAVTGGFRNRAYATYAAVSGGAGNRSGVGAGISLVLPLAAAPSVSGGVGNIATGQGATVTGGFGNTASGADSSVSGGTSRTVGGESDWRAGELFQDQ